jgi:predicted alpha/beta superfamily hydrolase
LPRGFILLFFFQILALGALWRPAFAQGRHTLTGQFRMHKSFHSGILQNDRDVLVYLPPGYDTDEKKRYAVLYLQDGQNLFDGSTSFIPGVEWRVDETAQSLISARMIRPLIIVGIYNTGASRTDEYTPTRDPKQNVGGKADAYGRMLVEELKPFIDSQYRTRPGRSDTGLGGSSLGGLVSLYVGLKYPKVFGKLAVVSPSVWWDQRVIIRDVQTIKKRPDTRIWLDMGTNEGNDTQAALRDARLLRDTLISKGWKPGSDLVYFEAHGGNHSEAAWAERVAPILIYLFPNRD